MQGNTATCGTRPLAHILPPALRERMLWRRVLALENSWFGDFFRCAVTLLCGLEVSNGVCTCFASQTYDQTPCLLFFSSPKLSIGHAGSPTSCMKDSGGTPESRERGDLYAGGPRLSWLEVREISDGAVRLASLSVYTGFSTFRTRRSGRLTQGLK